MKSSEIEIMRVYLCALDKAEGGPFFNEVKINDEDLMYGYLQKMIAANMDNTKAKAASFAEGSDLDRMVTDRLTLGEIDKAINMMINGDNLCKIIIDCQKV